LVEAAVLVGAFWGDETRTVRVLDAADRALLEERIGPTWW